jgi:PPOX class probable F420-dependent enzyme
MDAEAARAFLREHHRAVLVTTRPSDGLPQTSPVTAVVDGEGLVVVSTRETAMKVTHVERRPRAALCAFTDGFFGAWVQVEGPVEVVRLPEAMDGLVDYYRRASGEHPDWDDYRAAMERDRRVLLRMTIERAGPDVSG